MDYTKEMIAARRLEIGIAEARKKLNERRAELRAEKLELRKKEFDKLPLNERRIRERLGWSPYQADKPIVRYGSAFVVKK